MAPPRNEETYLEIFMEFIEVFIHQVLTTNVNVSFIVSCFLIDILYYFVRFIINIFFSILITVWLKFKVLNIFF